MHSLSLVSAFSTPLSIQSQHVSWHPVLNRDLSRRPSVRQRRKVRRPRSPLPIDDDNRRVALLRQRRPFVIEAKTTRQSKDIASLRVALVDACLDPALNRGLQIDPDATAETVAEEKVEDLAEKLEDANTCSSPTASPDMSGSWDLIYTSSTITRYYGGLSGMHQFVNGTVGRITQAIDLESGKCTFTEQISYELPVVGKTAVDVVVDGKIRAVNATRQMWIPDTIRAAWFRIWAESWKSIRAFTVAETTYLDKEIRITRGQTGALTVFARTQDT